MRVKDLINLLAKDPSILDFEVLIDCRDVREGYTIKLDKDKNSEVTRSTLHLYGYSGF